MASIVGAFCANCTSNSALQSRISASTISPTSGRSGTRKLCQTSSLSTREFLVPNKLTVRRLVVPKRRTTARLIVQASSVFDRQSTSLESAWTKLRNKDVLTTEKLKNQCKKSDVLFGRVVRKFVKSVSEKAVGGEVVREIRPDQLLVKVVNDELVSLMGGAMAGIEYAKAGPTIVLMAGLQGVGKTTASGKLALYFKKNGEICMMVATDIYRPAAIDQLVTLGGHVDVPVFEAGNRDFCLMVPLMFRLDLMVPKGL